MNPQINIWHREKTTFLSRKTQLHICYNQTFLSVEISTIFAGSYWQSYLSSVFVDTQFQCFTAVLILFCLSDNKDIVVTKYYANCFRPVLKMFCTALF